jgi:transcription-repair coupling factor (superfamily II helicase)
MGEEPPTRDELLIEPGAWRHRLDALARLGISDAETEQRFPLAPPDHVDRDLKRLRQIVLQPPPTVILCDNEGQLERLDELLGAEGATLAVGALDGGFIMPTLRLLTDHEIFRRARRLRRPRRYRSAVSTAASRPLTPGGYVVHLEHGIGIYRGLQTIAVGADGSRSRSWSTKAAIG